jgi:mono/diheme cytochrome c family protein
MVFKLGGTTQATPYDIPEPLRIDLTGVSSTGNVEAGFGVYMRHCQVCHGANATGGLLPDLRRSPITADAASWRRVVWDGANASRGMVGFRQWISEADMENIRAYVIQEARRFQRVEAAAAPAASPSSQP